MTFNHSFIAVRVAVHVRRSCALWQASNCAPRSPAACLQEPAHGTGDVAPIRAEACRRDRLLESEVVQQGSALAVDEQGTAILIY